MAHLIEVAFKGNRKDFFIWEQDDIPALKAPVVVEADRGEDIGRVHATGEQATVRNAGTPHGYGKALPARRARRLASPTEVAKLAELRADDEQARRRAMERVKANGLVMKVSDAEWQWDRKKLTFYFTAERRVDFRTLVRELASTFRTRIELKQIGVRDEAKRLDGVGRCGRPYCSSSWLPELLPVNLGVAKDQRLSLNPTQISGACGRLMCCLRYEHEFYVQSRKRFPKEGRVITTSRGEEKIVANDIFRERVTLRGTDNELRIVPLAELREEVAKTEPGASWLRHVPRPMDDDPEDMSDVDVGADMEAVAEVEDAEAAFEVIAEDAVPEATPDAVAKESAAIESLSDPDNKRPHRRRGRRGGRRNRSGHKSRGDDGGSKGGQGGGESPPATPPSTGV